MRFAPALQVCPIHERALKREVLVSRADCKAFRRSDMFDIMCVGGGIACEHNAPVLRRTLQYMHDVSVPARSFYVAKVLPMGPVLNSYVRHQKS